LYRALQSSYPDESLLEKHKKHGQTIYWNRDYPTVHFTGIDFIKILPQFFFFLTYCDSQIHQNSHFQSRWIPSFSYQFSWQCRFATLSYQKKN
jgi:hypothetical protein